MFGSNFPFDALHLTYSEVLDFIIDQFGDDADVLDKVMYQNAHRFYRFGGA